MGKKTYKRFKNLIIVAICLIVLVAQSSIIFAATKSGNFSSGSFSKSSTSSSSSKSSSISKSTTSNSTTSKSSTTKAGGFSSGSFSKSSTSSTNSGNSSKTSTTTATPYSSTVSSAGKPTNYYRSASNGGFSYSGLPHRVYYYDKAGHEYYYTAKPTSGGMFLDFLCALLVIGIIIAAFISVNKKK